MSATQQADYFSTQVVQNRRFFIPDWEERRRNSRSLGLVAGGCEWCAPEFRIERQHFPFLAFELVSKGKGRLNLGGSEHAISAGHAFFYDPNIRHVIASETDEPMVKYFFNFTGSYASRLLSELKLEPGTFIRVLDVSRIVMLLEEVIDHVLRGSTLGLRGAAVAIEHALVLCADGRQSAETRLDPAYESYLRCRGHLLRNYTTLTQIEEAAKNCQISAAYFTRLFQRFDNETPLTCLTRLKMSQAIILLREPGSQVKTVASELGYQSASHFSRAFKAWHHRTPQSVSNEQKLLSPLRSMN
jgi:AraC family transcriptional regulator, arabinose operon regulatory protein